MPTHHHFDFLELPSKDVKQLGNTRAFFGSVFGWTFEEYGPDYADIRGAGLSGGINADGEHRPAAPLAVVFSQDLEATRAKVLAAGGTLTRDIFTFPGGRRFQFREPSGNELGVWSDR